MSYACATTELQNVSGRTLSYVSMFRLHNMAPGQTVSVPGSVWAWLAANNPGIKGRRLIDALNDLIDNKVLAIVGVPTICGDVFGSSSSTVATTESSSSAAAAESSSSAAAESSSSSSL